MPCTGRNNYFVRDTTGTFLPRPGILLANNSWIDENLTICTKIPTINEYYCADDDFGVLEYENIAPDFNKRLMWPVYLYYEGSNWTS